MAQPSDETVQAWIKAGPYGTKSKLAKRCGLSPTEVGRWAQGQLPPERHWRAIEQFFHKPKGSIARHARASGARAPVVDSERRFAAIERELAAQRELVEVLIREVRALGSDQRVRR